MSLDGLSQKASTAKRTFIPHKNIRIHKFGNKFSVFHYYIYKV